MVMVKKELKGKEERLGLVEESIADEEKKLNSVKGLIEERRKEIELKEKEVMVVKRETEDCEKEFKGKKERRTEVEESIADCCKVLESKKEMVHVADEKGTQFGLLKRSMEEWCCKVEVKEWELEGMAAKLELKDNLAAKPVKSRIVSLVKIEEPESSAANNAATFSSSNPQSSATTDARDSQGSINEPLSWNVDTIHNQIVAAVQSTPDPEKFVLEMMQKSLVKYWRSAEASLKKGVMSFNISLLKVLMRVSPQVGSHVKEGADKLGLQWKAKIRADAEHLEHLMEIVGFLLFTVAYGLLPTLNVDEIIKFLERLSQHKEPLESCPIHGFLDKILGKLLGN